MHTVAGGATRRPDVRVDGAGVWTMVRGAYLARCDLRQRARAWEVAVFIDDRLLLSRHCLTPGEAAAVSSGWRTRLGASGWSQAAD